MVFSSNPDSLPEYSDCTIEPGSYALYELPQKVCSEWVLAKQKSYYTIPNSVLTRIDGEIEEKKEEIIKKWRTKIEDCLTAVIRPFIFVAEDEYHEKEAKTRYILRKLLSKSVIQEPNNNIILYDQIDSTIISANTWIHLSSDGDWNSMFDYDTFIRNQLLSAKFETGVFYPFFNTDFVALYFSIPLNWRYLYHTELFV
jgi:hypothetical protein